MEDFLWETKQEGVAVVKPGGDETVDSGSCMWCERGTDTIYNAEVEVGCTGYIVDV